MSGIARIRVGHAVTVVAALMAVALVLQSRVDAATPASVAHFRLTGARAATVSTNVCTVGDHAGDRLLIIDGATGGTLVGIGLHESQTGTVNMARTRKDYLALTIGLYGWIAGWTGTIQVKPPADYGTGTIVISKDGKVGRLDLVLVPQPKTIPSYKYPTGRIHLIGNWNC